MLRFIAVQYWTTLCDFSIIILHKKSAHGIRGTGIPPGSFGGSSAQDFPLIFKLFEKARDLMACQVGKNLTELDSLGICIFGSDTIKAEKKERVRNKGLLGCGS